MARECRLRYNPRGRSLSSRAQAFIGRHIEHHIRDLGMEPRRAIRAAYEEAAGKGFSVPAPNPKSPKKGVRRWRRITKRVRSLKPSRAAIAAARRGRKSNPIIGESLLSAGLSYRGGDGKAKGSNWRHPWGDPAAIRVRGGPRGSVVLERKDGKKLWDWFQAPKGKRGIA